MGYCEFLASLFADGRVTVDDDRELSKEELAKGESYLREQEQGVRLEAPGEPPPLSMEAASWASEQFYRACQFVVYRDLPAETIETALGAPFPGQVQPATHYSVDLVMRFLPDLLRFASSASTNDPLVSHLSRWAHQWPLSSVGVPKVEDVSVDGFADDPSLLQMYTDRIITANDSSRLNDPRVCQAVKSVCGMFPELGGRLASTLQANRTEEPLPANRPQDS